MAGRVTTRSKTELDERRAKVAELYVCGKTQEEIGCELGVDVSTISRDIAAIRALWRQQATEELGEHQARVLAELQAVKRRAWQEGNLKAILSAIAQERQLLGLDALTAANVTLIEKLVRQVREMPDEDLLRMMGYEHEPDSQPAGT